MHVKEVKLCSLLLFGEKVWKHQIIILISVETKKMIYLWKGLAY